MDVESTTLNLLRKKRQIIRYYYKGYAHLLTLLGIIASLSALFFFTFANFIYQTSLQIIHGYISQGRLTTLVNISESIGSFLCLCCLFLAMVIALKMILLFICFPNWLKKQTTDIQETVVTGQNHDSYLLSHNNKRMIVTKSTSQLLTTSLEGNQLKIGQRLAFLGLTLPIVFLLAGEPAETLKPPSRCNWNKILLRLFSFVMILGIVCACIFMLQTKSHQELAAEFNYQQGLISRELREQEANEMVVKQIGDTPTNHSKESNYLQLQGKELYMTTDSGTTWQFVPIKPEWLTEKTSSTHNIAKKNDWMDQIYHIDSEFSWFIFSPGSKSPALYQLSSRDKGKTWQKNLISHQSDPIRYRKVTFFEDGSGVAVFSTTFSHSEEFLRIFTTADYGQTWRKSGKTLVGKPVQNASYLSPAAGFLATQDDLYYTRNHGQSFNKAIITIPEGYSAKDLSFFQAPNTIMDTGSAKLEATFHLANTRDRPNRKVFACLFQSVNEGKSWTFVKQLSQITSLD